MLRQAALPFTKQSSWMRTLVMAICGSFLIALFAPVAIPLPFTPVPIGLQAQVCLFLGVVFGSRIGALSVFAFILQGAMGLPVFAMGHAGIGILLGPRGGYLIGYLIAAWVAGYLVERSGSKSLRQATLAMAVGNLVIYVCGLSQLSLFVGIEKVFLLGMFPFLIGDLFKLFIANRALKTLGFI
ncbi:MAG: biotin transporter BioY [Thermodesulfobacteriota bacterium]